MRVGKLVGRGLALLFIIISANELIAQENIALIADGIQTSYVSSWENLYAINNNIVPVSSADKSGGAYGNWSGSDGGWQWVEYSWDQLYELSRSDVYWWADGQGILLPAESYQEYWDLIKNEWLPLPGMSGNGHVPDQFNITTFSPVLTNRIRVYMISSVATGILEWRVWGSIGEQIPSGSVYELDTPLAKSLTSQLLLTAKDEAGFPVQDYVFKLKVSVKDELSSINESYLINGSAYSGGIYEIDLDPTNAAGESVVSISIPSEIDPADGIALAVFFNNAKTILTGEIFLYETGLTPPVLSADNDENNTDNELELTFSDDEVWRNSILYIYSDDIPLEYPSDYEIAAGSILLKPAGGNAALTVAGTHEIRIHAAGYEDVVLEQQIQAGAPAPANCKVQTLLNLYRPTSTSIQISCLDKYDNPVVGTILQYSVTILDNSTVTNEEYRVNDVTVSDNLSNQTTNPGNSEGNILLPLYIPREIDLNDGIQIDFNLEDNTPLNQNIVFIHDGSDKEIVLQRAVRDNAGFSWDRTAQSENFIVYWGQKIQGDPADAVNGNISFDPANILQIMELLLSYFNDTIGFIENPDDLNMAQYKHEIVMNETWNSGFTGWAFGGWADALIGGMWIHPQATSGPAVLAHEFTHMNQAMVKLQYPGYGLDTPYAGFFWESHANFMMKTYSGTYTGVQPERYVFTSMMHFSTTRRHYQNVYFIDYLVDKYGIQTVNDIWRKADPGYSHPLTSLRDSVLRYTQDDLNNDIATHAMRNVTWDYSNGDKIRAALNSVDPIYLQREYTVLDTIFDEPGTYIVPEYLAPGDYGYNIIPLYLDEGSSTITVDFEGLDNSESGGAGWRYAFVAEDVSGGARYSEIYSAQSGTVSFQTESQDSAYFLVVVGAPQNHHNYKWEVGFARNYRYPYKLVIQGAKPEGYKPGYNDQSAGIPGAPHPNGGGWVASTASVASTAWVGPNAQVLGTAKVYDNARVEDYAILERNAVLRNNAVVRDHAIVGIGSSVTDNAIVEKNARVYNYSEISGNAVVTGSALLYYVKLSGSAVVKDLARLSNSTISGTAIIGGDAEEYTDISAGTYLKFDMPLTGRIDATDNIEVNPYWTEYVYPKGDKPTVPSNLQGSGLNSGEIGISWNKPLDHRELGAYYIYINGSLVSTTTDTSFVMKNLAAGTSYTFAIQAVDRSGNLSLISDPVSVSTSPAGVEETLNEGFNIFPNPVTDLLYLESSWPGSTDYIITDMTGRIVLSGSFTSKHCVGVEKINGNGIYNVSLVNGNKKCTTKILFSR